MRLVLILAAALALASCGGSDTYEDEVEAALEDEYPEDSDSGADYGEEVVAGETYDEFDERRDELDGEYGSYAGYGCTVDCSGHEAGYNWAADNGITDPASCGGNSWSFIEGCRAYAEENEGLSARWVLRLSLLRPRVGACG